MPMRTLTPRSFPNLAQCDALSKNTLEAHIRLYEGYVNSYNKLMAKRHTHLSHGPATSA